MIENSVSNIPLNNEDPKDLDKLSDRNASSVLASLEVKKDNLP